MVPNRGTHHKYAKSNTCVYGDSYSKIYRRVKVFEKFHENSNKLPVTEFKLKAKCSRIETLPKKYSLQKT